MKNQILTELREKAALTQAELAAKAGISVRGYQRYEAGNRIPDVYTGQRIAHAVGSTVEQIFPASGMLVPRADVWE